MPPQKHDICSTVKLVQTRRPGGACSVALCPAARSPLAVVNVQIFAAHSATLSYYSDLIEFSSEKRAVAGKGRRPADRG